MVARRETCEYCTRYTTSFLPLQDGGYQCRYERNCIRKRQTLPAVGIEELRRKLDEHKWNLTRTARSIGVTYQSVVKYLKRHDPGALAGARRNGLIKMYWVEADRHKLTDPNRIRRAMRMHGGHRGKAAAMLGVHCHTLVSAMARLLPGEFTGRPDRRRAA